MQKIKTQILIIGGGIAGCWLLSKLKELGYAALLCEKTALGNGQTIASQGIIHGGMKYSLTGKISPSTTNIGGMPKVWKHCIDGNAQPNLKNIKVLSEHQYLWTTKKITSELTAFFASKLMQNKMQKMATENYPPIFRNKQFKNTLYQLNEMVLDMPSILNVFKNNHEKELIHVNEIMLQQSVNDLYEVKLKTTSGSEYNVAAEKIICLAGEGNESLVNKIGFKMPVMQKRPLQMVLVRGELPLVYGHALGMDNLPRITITSHLDSNGKTVWYLGGRPAEKGVGVSMNELIDRTKKELKKLMPWVDISKTEWATWNINRAEGFQKNGKRPDKPVLQMKSNICVAWPTKLAFAPLLSEQIIDWIKKEQIKPSGGNNAINFPTPPIAIPIWEREDVIWN